MGVRDPDQRIAVIGSGVAGLTTARELDRKHAVTLYEAERRIGGHARTVRVDDPRGEQWIDTGFIVHNDRNYPAFTALLSDLGVTTRPAQMGMSIASDDGRFEFAYTRRGLFAQRSNLLRPRFWRLIRDQLRFNREVRPLAGRPGAPTVGEFLRDSGYSRWFCERAIVPEISAVWSADPAEIWEFPLGFLAEFLEHHGQLQLRRRPAWRTIDGGSRVYVSRLLAEFRGRVRAGAPVRSVRSLPHGVLVVADGCPDEVYDQVVIAVHADQALAMLAEPTQAEREVLGSITYQANEAILHTDGSLMPRRRRAWAGWNYHLGNERRGRTAVTYWMNNLQGLDAGRDYFVTLNLGDRIAADEVIETVRFDHPQATRESVAAQARWDQISGVDGVHYCGAYWRWGFHEDGCWSALRACERVTDRATAFAGLELAA
jgi:predicted NAD/FAD-binding protein